MIHLNSKIRKGVWVLISMLAVLFIVPLITSDSYHLHLLIIFFMHVALAESWNIVFGLGGLPSLSHHQFIGVGAYATALTLTSGLSIFLALPLSGITAFALALSVGYPLTRLRGPPFAVASIAVAETVMQIFINTPQIGGALGISLPITSFPTKAPYYYISMILGVITVFAVYAVKFSKLGFALTAINENERTAKSIGINSIKYKVLIFSLGAVFAGIAGGLYAYYNTYVEPHSVFNFVWMMDIMLITIIGGLGSIEGPIIGAFVFMILKEYVRYQWVMIHLLVGGILVMIIMAMFPTGLWGLLNKLRAYTQKKTR